MYVGAHSFEFVKFKHYHPLTYYIEVSVRGDYFGECNIGVKILGSSLRTIKFLGSVSCLNYNLILIWPGTFYIKLDNTYSMLTSKTVRVTIKAYLLVDYMLNDDIFKMVAITL
ncbi:MAG: hypothetical protein QXX41_08430 [Nitrososphaerota archaeon]